MRFAPINLSMKAEVIKFLEDGFSVEKDGSKGKSRQVLNHLNNQISKLTWSDPNQ